MGSGLFDPMNWQGRRPPRGRGPGGWGPPPGAGPRAGPRATEERTTGEQRQRITAWVVGAAAGRLVHRGPPGLGRRRRDPDRRAARLGRAAERRPPPRTSATAESARITGHREDTRDQRVRIAEEAEGQFGRIVSWGARCGDTLEMFTSASVPVMTRLRDAGAPRPGHPPRRRCRPEPERGPGLVRAARGQERGGLDQRAPRGLRARRGRAREGALARRAEPARLDRHGTRVRRHTGGSDRWPR